jgi:hypothetical protein
MPNPVAPVEGGSRRIPFLIDPDNPGVAYLQAGEGGIDMGAGRTDGAAAYVLPPPANEAVRTSVAGAEVDTLILAANPVRRGAMVYNEGDVTLYLALGEAAATLTDYSVAVAMETAFPIPAGYTGEVRGIWGTIGSGDTAAARVTEWTSTLWLGS